MSSLFDPYDLGPFRLKNRVVMAPMERSRARNPDWAPEAETARYFAQLHEQGGVIFGQIRHGGRASHVSHQPNRQSTVSATDDHLLHAKPPRHQIGRVARFADADGEVDALVDHIDQSVGKTDVELQGGTLRRHLEQDRHHV